ncbi:MAG TPA: sigma 54-interacting transcriptional regulator [Planctomycetota bacterium]|nr:sigma 54-interacting transcriptional regulator [Planctomycetota bacterium]
MTITFKLGTDAARALDGLAALRLRTAPHTEEARKQRLDLRERFGLRRPDDAIACFDMVVQEGPRGDEMVERLLLEWPLAIALEAAINLEDPDGVKPLITRLARSVPHLGPRVEPIVTWARRARDVTEAMGALVGRSRAMDDVRTATWRAVFTDDVRKALALRSPHRLSVLVTGESGTGKELIARTIAASRPRDAKGHASPYVALNIAGVTPSLVNSALFGHVRGAFTGATEAQEGVFQAADGGVLFLDEIGDASSAVQVRLLRTLQEGTVRPVGAEAETPVQVRVVAATNRDLFRRGKKKGFRRDLLERLSVLRVHAPPLRERLEDVPELVRNFVAETVDVSAWPSLVDEVKERLDRETKGYDWPGNVRELKAAVDRAVAGQPARLETDDTRASSSVDLVRELGVLALDEVRRRYVEAIVKRTRSKSEAAKLLGIDRNTLARILNAKERDA